MRRLSIPRVPRSSLVALVALVSTTACTDNVLSPGTEETGATPNLARRRRAVVSVDVTPGGDTLSAAHPTTTLRATARDANGNVVKRASVTWTTLDPQIASVDAVGRVTAKRVGTALIVAAAAAVADTAVVLVEDVAASVTVTPASVSLTAGDSAVLSAVARDSAGNSIGGAAVTWTTSDPGVATVSSAGTVRGVSAGTAVVKATSGAASAVATITVAADTTAPTEPTPPEPTPPGDSTTGPTTCSAYPHDRLVNVSTASQLTSALSAAQPGDLIQLADGTYAGPFTAYAAGTATKPIVVCGTSRAVLNGGGLGNPTVLRLAGVHDWTLDGFTVTNALIGIRLQSATRVTLRRITLHDFGQEAVVVKTASRHNVLDSLRVYNTGRTMPQYGEGVYIGTTYTQWTNGQPDRSDSNVVRRSVFGPNIATEAVDIKDGATGTIVQNNSFNGTGFSTYAAAWVNTFGNGTIVTGNSGSVSRQHGFKVESLAPGWGNGNVFHDNVADLSGATGYGVYVGSTPTGVVVGCDNAVEGRPLSNRSCTP